MKRALVELGELLGDADLVEAGLVEVVAEEDVARNAGDVFLDEGVAVDEIVDAVWREDVFEFEAEDARGVGVLDVEIVRVVVEEIGDADAERAGVSEIAVIDAVHEQVFVLGGVAAEFEFGVDGGEARPEFREDLGRIHHGEPEGFAALRVLVGDGAGEAAEFAVDPRDVPLAVEVIEILPQRLRDGVADFSPGDHAVTLNGSFPRGQHGFAGPWEPAQAAGT